MAKKINPFRYQGKRMKPAAIVKPGKEYILLRDQQPRLNQRIVLVHVGQDGRPHYNIYRWGVHTMPAGYAWKPCNDCFPPPGGPEAIPEPEE